MIEDQISLREGSGVIGATRKAVNMNARNIRRLVAVGEYPIVVDQDEQTVISLDEDFVLGATGGDTIPRWG